MSHPTAVALDLPRHHTGPECCDLSTGQPGYPLGLRWNNEGCAGARDDHFGPRHLLRRIDHLPEPHRMAGNWCITAIKSRSVGLYLARAESSRSDAEPVDLDFDAAVKFGPCQRPPRSTACAGHHRNLGNPGLLPTGALDQRSIDRGGIVLRMRRVSNPGCRRIRCTGASDENPLARRRRSTRLPVNSTPEAIGCWLTCAGRRVGTGTSGRRTPRGHQSLEEMDRRQSGCVSPVLRSCLPEHKHATACDEAES